MKYGSRRTHSRGVGSLLPDKSGVPIGHPKGWTDTAADPVVGVHALGCPAGVQSRSPFLPPERVGVFRVLTEPFHQLAKAFLEGVASGLILDFDDAVKRICDSRGHRTITGGRGARRRYGGTGVNPRTGWE